jgi:hypothetical protein
VARRTGRFPQLADPRGGLIGRFFATFVTISPRPACQPRCRESESCQADERARSVQSLPSIATAGPVGRQLVDRPAGDASSASRLTPVVWRGRTPQTGVSHARLSAAIFSRSSMTATTRPRGRALAQNPGHSERYGCPTATAHAPRAVPQPRMSGTRDGARRPCNRQRSRPRRHSAAAVGHQHRPRGLSGRHGRFRFDNEPTAVTVRRWNRRIEQGPT